MPLPASDLSRARTVLVVEDEAQICALITDYVEAEGFATRCVQTDQDAYRALEHDGAYACMIIDVNLGTGTTGYDVARFARQIDGALPIIFVSGQTSPESFHKNGVPGSLFLPKPFSSDELLARLNMLVGDNDD
ncbi:response regulator transcription factor [Phenylobacterium sp.]|jgi:DNA-binding response OmpR family regulator|uniref:response regulator transcription factor n=1 Tax=Phenylobacterium sp. TaxID=1871053 RepID=UPI002F940864